MSTETPTAPATAGRSVGATEAAAMLGVSARTLDRMEHDGRLRPIRRAPGPRGRRYYDVVQVERVRRGLPADDGTDDRTT